MQEGVNSRERTRLQEGANMVPKMSLEVIANKWVIASNYHERPVVGAFACLLGCIGNPCQNFIDKYRVEGSDQIAGGSVG
jgi:hypothetical protein